MIQAVVHALLHKTDAPSTGESGARTSKVMDDALVARLVTIGSTAVLGNMYWRMQRQWRRDQLSARSARRR